MAEQSVAVELFYDGVWNNLVTSADVLEGNQITITRGQGDESASPRPAQIALSLNNDDDQYRTSNPESPLYGKAGRNTPIRVKVGTSVRGIAEASSMSPDQDLSFNPTLGRGRAWVDVEAGGLLQRIGQWTDALRSPMYRQISSYTSLTGYWPLEDPSGSTVLSQRVASAGQGFTTGTVNLAGVPGAAGSEPNPTLGTDGSINGYFRTPSGNGFQVCWVMKLEHAPPGGGGYNTVLRFIDSTGRTWAWNASSANFKIDVTDSDGTLLETSTASYGSLDTTEWVRYRLKVTVSGSTITYEPAWYPQSSLLITGWTDTFSSSATGRPRFWQATFNSTTDGAAYGHVFAVTDTSLDLTGGFDAYRAFDGYTGETAGARFTRLTGELGIPSSKVGTSADSFPMGAQKADTFPNLLKEIVATEDGLVFDDIDAIGLVFLLRNARYNQTPALALNATDLPALPREVTDDLDVHNVVTVTDRAGGDATATDDTGPLGTADPPTGVGIYRQTIDVNTYTPQTDLPLLADWWLYRGTVDLPRYPTVTVDLNAKPSLVTAANAVDIGSVITITGYRENVIRLFVLGWTEVIGTHSRTITFTCRPDQQFYVGEWDDGLVRWDSASSEVKAGVNSTNTSITFRTTNVNDIWDTTAEPYDVFIGGERLTVTTMGAASLVSGAYDQAATVVRSVNGVSKSLAAGTKIHIATPGRWAL